MKVSIELEFDIESKQTSAGYSGSYFEPPEPPEIEFLALDEVIYERTIIDGEGKRVVKKQVLGLDPETRAKLLAAMENGGEGMIFEEMYDAAVDYHSDDGFDDYDQDDD
jgi:hypothetical protein